MLKKVKKLHTCFVEIYSKYGFKTSFTTLHNNTFNKQVYFNPLGHKHNSNLKDEIDSILSPLSSTTCSEITEDQNTLMEHQSSFDDEDESIDNDDDTIDTNEVGGTLKKHFVTPSTTKINVAELIINDVKEDEEMEYRHQIDNYNLAEKRARLGSISNSSSTCSSSPFELCEVHEGVVVEHAVIENSFSGKTLLSKLIIFTL